MIHDINKRDSSLFIYFLKHAKVYDIGMCHIKFASFSSAVYFEGIFFCFFSEPHGLYQKCQKLRPYNSDPRAVVIAKRLFLELILGKFLIVYQALPRSPIFSVWILSLVVLQIAWSNR